ncbi:MAG TPA: NrsF family protein, partial [Rubrivivax sp.]|nr:NrsF family protein [Rubrivivax sp.]
MKTDDLITLLAADNVPVVRRAALRHIAVCVAVGVALAAVLMQLGFGVRPDLAQAILRPTFWMKLLFPAAAALASLATLARLARPGVDARASALAIAVPIVLLWLMASA